MSRYQERPQLAPLPVPELRRAGPTERLALAGERRMEDSRPSFVRRHRLIARLHELVHRRLTLVVAPAGYGKTTLLADFAADCATGDLPISVCWFTAAAGETDGLLALRGIVLALRDRYLDFGARTLRLLAEARPGAAAADAERLLASAMGVLVHELEERVTDYTLLVVDDYHLLDPDAPARAALEQLLGRMPAHVHVALLSRTVPSLDTTRLILADDLGALGPRDLAFTGEELALFLRQRYRLEPDAALVAHVLRRTEGWIAGLVLAMPGPIDGPPRVRTEALLAALSDPWRDGERLHDFLVLHLLRRQTPQSQEVLLAAALPEVCDARELDQVLQRSDSAAILAQLERAGVPLTRVGARYRLHALLRDALRAHLEHDDRRRYEQLRRRWGTQAEATGDAAAALAHYLAAHLYEAAAKVMERVGERWIDAGQRSLVGGALAELPPALAQKRPRLGLVAGRLALAEGRAAMALERARQAGFAAQRARDSVAACRALLLEAMAAVAAGRPDEAVQLCSQALAQRTVRRHKPLLAEAYRSLSMAETIHGLAKPALEHMEQALALYERAGRTWDVAVALNNLGVLHEQLGQPEQARWRHTRALALRREMGDLAGVARSLNNLGLLQFSAGAYEEAEAMFREALSVAELTANRRSEAVSWINIGDLRRAQQRPADGLACYHAAQAAARVAVDPRWEGFALLGEAAAHLALGHAVEAERSARLALQAADRNGLLEVAGQAQTVLAAAAMAAGRFREAGALLEAGRRAAGETGSKALQVRVYLWSAALAHRQRRWGEALACVQVAAEAAVALGGTAALALEGPSLVPVLRLAAERGLAVDPVTRALDQLDAAAAAAVREAASPPAEPAALPSISLRLLGAFGGRFAGRAIETALAPRSRVRELFVYLAMHPTGRRREEIGADLWPDAEPGHEATLTHTTLHRLRQILFRDVVAGDGAPPGASGGHGMYRINPHVALDVDVHRFEHALRSAEQAGLPPARRRRLLARAVATYGGPFFPECYADWAIDIRHRLERRYVTALAQLADLEWQSGQYRQCLAWCERLLEVDSAEAAIHYRILECYDRLAEPLAGVLHYHRYASELPAGTDAPPRAPHDALERKLAALAHRLEARLADPSVG